MARFFHQVLRTTDVASARGFYAAVLGDERAEIVALHEQALARGAKPHWLAMVAVADVGAALTAFVARGATQLGPKWLNADGLEVAVMRDPGGAIVAVGEPPDGWAAAGPKVVWRLLNTPDVERARANYEALFGWRFLEVVELPGLGTFQQFAWESGPAAGAMTDIAERPSIHPHWLLHFAVERLEPALAAVDALGGTRAPLVSLPNGGRVAVCDDPQGAAFALYAPGSEAASFPMSSQLT
jgi:uncharacterized protein